jgi:hypothetical protein
MTDIMLFVLSEDIDVTCKGARVSKRDRSIEAVGMKILGIGIRMQKQEGTMSGD